MVSDGWAQRWSGRFGESGVGNGDCSGHLARREAANQIGSTINLKHTSKLLQIQTNENRIILMYNNKHIIIILLILMIMIILLLTIIIIININMITMIIMKITTLIYTNI